jgi:hypothetical protein
VRRRFVCRQPESSANNDRGLDLSGKQRQQTDGGRKALGYGRTNVQGCACSEMNGVSVNRTGDGLAEDSAE